MGDIADINLVHDTILEISKERRKSPAEVVENFRKWFINARSPDGEARLQEILDSAEKLLKIEVIPEFKITKYDLDKALNGEFPSDFPGNFQENYEIFMKCDFAFIPHENNAILVFPFDVFYFGGSARKFAIYYTAKNKWRKSGSRKLYNGDAKAFLSWFKKLLEGENEFN
jgi:hypothetical protein